MSYFTEVKERREFVTEMKYLVPLANAAAVRDWARARLRPDPNGGGPHGDSYHTSSLYFDTCAFDVFHRRGSFGRSKYRIRRYGSADFVFLERKLKTRNWVGKRRSTVVTHELHRLCDALPQKGWAGYWYHRRVLARELNLVCSVSYNRTALLLPEVDDGIRLTLDTDVMAAPAAEIGFGPRPNTLAVTPANAILELKYRRTPPRVFQELIETFSLTSQAVSKYRLSVAALGLCAEPPVNAMAAASTSHEVTIR